ncbi:AMP-binding protein [Candidatus Parcubacteria bacterium]|nr:MAG: AMP-binding protein [Candidatus Parcubacteria bacterium]
MIPNAWSMRTGIDDWYEKTRNTWGNALNRAAADHSNVEAIVYKNRRITFGQLRRYVDSFANGLMALGIKAGDNVGLWMTNCPEWVVSQFAIYKIGARMVAINTRYRLSELEYVLKQSDCTALIMNDVFLEKTNAVDMIMQIVPGIEQNRKLSKDTEDVIEPKHVVILSRIGKKYAGTFDFNEVLETGDHHGSESALIKTEAQVSPTDIMSIQYTSGTTGFPKGVMCTHRSNMASFFCAGVGVGYRNGKDRMIVALPFFTNAGALGCSATSILFGVTMVVLEQYDPEECIKIIEKEKVTIGIGSDNMYINIMNNENFSKHDLSSLRGGIMAGGHNPVEVIKEVMAIVPEITMVYGLTENSGLGSMVLYDDPIDKRLRTSGRPMPYTRIGIMDDGTRNILGQNENGEICTRDILPNSSVMAGYYKKEKETREAIDKDGWLHTGDLGLLDEDGYLIVTGRLKDMFTSGGNNVYPAEIENYLHTHPLVKQVAVVGIPDEVKGGIPMAYVILKENSKIGSDEIIAYCMNNIASYKVPKYVEFVSELPLTSSGKVQKVELKERAIKQFGLEEIGKKRKM